MNNEEYTNKTNTQLSIADDDNGYAEFCAYLEASEAEQDDPEAFTDEAIIERGTIVKIKPEWLNPGESGQMHYVVVKEYDENRILIQALGTGYRWHPPKPWRRAWSPPAAT